MKVISAAVLFFLLITCDVAMGQSLKITSIGSADRISAKILEKQLVGKKLELTLYKDSALVFVVPLHQREKMKQVSMNQYMRTDSTEKERTLSLLTISQFNGQLLSVNLKLLYSDLQGDQKEIWIIAKPE
ncbi:MAG: hypothetical protein ACXVA2_07660 [Mucilaginibacter sp.]